MKKLKAIFCALFGHSKVQTSFFGHFNCARCEQQVGDNLGGVYDASKVVIVGHDCSKCRENYKSLKWRDRFLVPWGWKPEDE